MDLQRQRAELQFTVERLSRENRQLEAANEHYREHYETLRRLARQHLPFSATGQPGEPTAEPA
jgi:cell division protein FtsB